jgi:hypothetical protein
VWLLLLLIAAGVGLPGELCDHKSVVVYAGFKGAADMLAGQLQRAAVAARPYHAGLPLQHRDAVQVGSPIKDNMTDNTAAPLHGTATSWHVL